MPYDPRMLQMAQMGVGMMGPQQSNQPKRWWEEPLSGRSQQGGQQDDPSKPTDPKQPPSLLQMLMQGSKPPTGGAAPSGSYGAIPGAGLRSVGLDGLNNPWLYT
jgi:hypothetical protein